MTAAIHQTLIERLNHFAKETPDQDAIITAKISITYNQLATLVDIQANEFLAKGISETSAIGINCSNDTEHLILCLAAIKTGAMSCTVPSHESESVQKSVVDSFAATQLVTSADVTDLSSLEKLPEPKISEESNTESQLLFSTSGTTGNPKLVVFKDSDLVAQAHRHVNSTEERFACLASIEQNFAKRHRLYCVAAGATNVFLDGDLDQLVSQCLSLGVNVLHVSAFQAQELLALENISRLSNIRLKLGGSHVPLPLREKLKTSITNNLQAGYGTTETGAIGFTDPNDSESGESVGQALPGIDIRAVSTERLPLETGERGEIAIRCEGMFQGYLGRSDLTDAKLCDDWFYTGDIGYLDKQNRIHLCGRSDDMFVFNSMNIYPHDIEAQIRQFPNITDAAVVPKTSALHGSIPVALIVFSERKKSDLQELEKFVRSRTGIRSPRHYTIVDKIPRNATGKISRQIASNISDKGSNVRESIVQLLLNAFKDDKEKLALVKSFIETDFKISLHRLNLDSITRMELMIVLETEFDTVIMPDQFTRFRYLGDIVSFVLNKPPVDEGPAIPAQLQISVSDNKSRPAIANTFKRAFRFARTAAQLNKFLTSLENRITPVELKHLEDQHQNNDLLGRSSEEKYHQVLNQWFMKMNRMMIASEKSHTETFTEKRITPTATLYQGTGNAASKTLIICFSGRGGRHLMIPNTVLMQHTDSTLYDLLIIAEPLDKNYRYGVPWIGNKLIEVCQWITNLDLVKNYSKTRTIGCSAGGFPAILTAYYLNSEISVSVGGRFFKSRQTGQNLKMLTLILLAKLKSRGPQVFLSYPPDKSRDKKFALTMSRLFGYTSHSIKFPGEKTGHRVLQKLMQHGKLNAYLEQTIFSNPEGGKATQINNKQPFDLQASQ